MLDRISIQGTDSEALRTHIVERLTHALNQHQKHVKSISVHTSDINGANRGGEDRRMNFIVHLDEGQDVIVEERGADPYAVASTGADRVKQVVGRRLHKLVDQHHHHAPTTP